MAQEKKYDVFISYSRKDSDEVKAFVDMLKKRIPTIDVWMDLKGITVADEFDEKIISAIDASSYVIFAVSPNSNSIGEGSSKWTKKELVYAKNTDKKVIPVLLNGAKLNSWFLFEFGRTDCIDTTDTLQVEKLIENLSFLTNKPTFEEELRREKERKEREAELARKEAELERLRKEKELQERMAQAEAEEQEKEMIEEPDFIESAEILNNESQESSSKSLKKTGLKKILKIAVLSLAGIMLIFGTILAIARRTLKYEYDYTNHTATVIQRMPIFRYSGNINIPKIIKHKGECFQVTSIGESAFSWCKSLTSITIPNSVTEINAWVFEGCSGLTSITIPNSVTSIGKDAFSWCKGLTSITIPNSVTSIGDGAFRFCSGLTSITIPNSVIEINAWVFEGCSGLTSITIPNSVTSIGYQAFSGCDALKSIRIPKSVTYIGEDAFHEHTQVIRE